MRVVPLRKVVLFSVLAVLFALGYTRVAKAAVFKVDHFQDDAVGWATTAGSTTDSDDDGSTDDEEGCNTDRDGDGIPDCQDYDPTGYFYDQANGKILSGGSITVNGCANTIIPGKDGSAGDYQFVPLGIAGTCTITITNPPGYTLATATCPNLDPPPFDVPAGPGPPVVLGGTEVGATGFLNTAGTCTPYYFSLIWHIGDVELFANNFPFVRSGSSVAPAASHTGLVVLTLVLLLAASWKMGFTRRTE